ncbi:hypothetical protein H0H92_010279 [Tricholoma furcatifolium]|nr:hypothetical protein H0H92_010279 [Tricholoma furcatifolium]
MANTPIPTKAQIDAAFSPALYGESSLWAVAVAQTTFYYRNFPSDIRLWSIVVGILIVLDTLHIFSLSAGIHDWFLIEHLSFRYPSGALIASFVTYIIETIVQLAYASRVWTPGGMGVGYELAVATSINSAHSVQTKAFGAVQLVGSVICDLLISATLVFYLNKNRNGVRRTDNIIDRLILYSINVGLLTSCRIITFISIVAILNLIFWWASPQNFDFVIFHYIISKLYINSLLVTYKPLSLKTLSSAD